MDTNVITPAVQLDGLTISFPSPDGSAKTVSIISTSQSLADSS